MLRTEPVKWGSWDYRVLDRDQVVTVIDRAMLRDRAIFALDGVEYRIISRSMFRAAWDLDLGTRTVARASRPSLFLRRLEVQAEDRLLTLEPVGLLSRSWRIRHGEREVGRLVPERRRSRAFRIDLLDRVPLPLICFAIFLVTTSVKRTRQAAAAGG